MKKIIIITIGLLTLCAGHLLDINAIPRKKRSIATVKYTKPTAYSTRTFNIAQTQLLQDLGPVSRQKTIDIPIPPYGLKNALLIQFKPTSDITLQSHQVNQVLVSTQPLNKKRATTYNLDWIPGKGQVLIEIFAGQNGAATDQSELARKYQHTLIKSELIKKGPLKVKVKNNGEVTIKMKDAHGTYTHMTHFRVALNRIFHQHQINNFNPTQIML